MPKIFNTKNIKIVEYGEQGEQNFSVSKIANDLMGALRKIVKTA